MIKVSEKEAILDLFVVKAIQFGRFKLKSGLISPYYIDLRLLCSYPHLLKLIADSFWEKLKLLNFDLIVGVPYTGIPIATTISLNYNCPMVFTRKRRKGYGKKKLVEGEYHPGQKVVVIDDVISDGASKLETIGNLEKEKLIVSDVVVFLDRDQGGKEEIIKGGYNFHSITSMTDVLRILGKERKLNYTQIKKTRDFIKNSSREKTNLICKSPRVTITVGKMNKKQNKKLAEEIALLLLKIKAVLFDFKNPISFSSGIVSPVFIDNRLIISYPEIRDKILNSFLQIIKENIGEENIDVISGTASAAIPHAALIAERLDKPMVYVRSREKAHGKENKIEGVIRKKQRVVVIEDHISTGGSAINNVLALRAAGARVNNCLAITSYGLKIAENLFKKHKINIFTLTNFQAIIDVALKEKYLTRKDKQRVIKWFKNPVTWGYT